MNVSVVIATCGGEAWHELAWARAYPSVSAFGAIVEHYPDLTVSQARNAGAEYAAANNPDIADGDRWLLFLDADDELESGYLEAMQDALDRNPSGIWEDDEHYEELWVTPPLLAPAVRYVRARNGHLSSSPAAIPNAGKWPRVNECVIGTLVRADLFQHVGGFRDRTDDGTELSSIEDYDLWLRCFDVGAALVHVPQAVYRAHVGDRSRNSDQSPYAAIWADHERRIAP